LYKNAYSQNKMAITKERSFYKFAGLFLKKIFSDCYQKENSKKRFSTEPVAREGIFGVSYRYIKLKKNSTGLRLLLP